MDLSLLNQADAATLQLERAKRALDAAKLDLDAAKKAYEEVLAQADEHGIPKAKLKKLAEDRVSALLDSGLLDGDGGARNASAAKPKSAKPKKAKADKGEDRADEDPAEAWAAKPEPHELEPADEVSH